MNELQIFRNEEFGQIRTIQLNNETFFVGKDVTDILGYQNGSRDINRHVDGDDKGVAKYDSLGGIQEMTVINESGLYALIFGSKLESAKRFKHWVTSEVLPEIRKTGSFNAEQTVMGTETSITLSTELMIRAGEAMAGCH